MAIFVRFSPGGKAARRRRVPKPQPECSEEPTETVTRDNYYIAGLVLLRQEYLATISELESADGLTKPQLDLLRTELDDEHRFRCAQEWKAIGSQIKADMDVKIGSTPVHKDIPYSPGPNRLGPSYWRWRG